MAKAQDAWVADGESLESVEGRIHDGWPLERLHERARLFIGKILQTCQIPRFDRDAVCVEIGSGVAYLMEAFLDATGVDQITGLDVSPSMIGQAQARIARDGLTSNKYNFIAYDGFTFPFADRSVDFFYSVAAIQHIPKPMAYKMFTEMVRCLKPRSIAVFNLMHWSILETTSIVFRQEIENQAHGLEGHWHFYYDKVELDAVFGALGVAAHIVEHGSEIWVKITAP